MESQLSRKKIQHNIMSFAGMLDNETAEGIRSKVEKQRADADREFVEHWERTIDR